jgi:hypothetical protein
MTPDHPTGHRHAETIDLPAHGWRIDPRHALIAGAIDLIAGWLGGAGWAFLAAALLYRPAKAAADASSVT